MEIRTIRADEWRRWRETRLRMLRDDATFFSSRYEDAVREPDAVWERWVAEAADGTGKVLFVAEEDGIWLGVVGAFVRVNPNEVHLVGMWVDPRGRGRGIARSLIHSVATWARERGASRVLLFVQEANAPARRLYEQAGFESTGETAPVGVGRTGFKLLLRGDVDRLLGDDPGPAADAV